MENAPRFELSTIDYEYKNGNWFWKGRVCEGADRPAFVPHNNVWAQDSKGLFKQGKRVKGADSASCCILNLLFAKDSSQVYYIMGVAKDVADVVTFEALDSGEYDTGDGSQMPVAFGFARDNVNVYAHHWGSGKPKILKGANRDTFRRLAHGFATDGTAVWYESWRIPRAEPASFVILNHLYSKDSRRVYRCETALPGADPSTMRVLNPGTAVDKSHVYVGKEIVNGADPITYWADPDDEWSGRDARHIFKHGKIIGEIAHGQAGETP